jgi:hypothetical protein
MRPGEMEELLASLGTCPIQKKGLFWRLFKLYWKKLLFIALMLVLPGGLIVLFLCATAWALNWEHEMTAYMDATYKKWKEEHDIHSE